MEQRRKTRRIRVGGVSVGGGAPVTVQSMTNTDTRDARATLAQIRSQAREGCEIVRVAVPDGTAAKAFRRIREGSPIPVIADPAAALYLKEVEKEKDPFSLAARLAPMDMVAFLERGKTAMNLARRTLKAVAQWQKTEKKGLKGLRKEPLIFPLAKVLLKAPVPRPGKIIAMGLNFRDHAEENKVPIPELPVGFLKASSCVVGPYDPVPYPHDSTQQLDYEIEMAIVVGKKGKNIPKEKAYEYVAGYMIINDLDRAPMFQTQGPDGIKYHDYMTVDRTMELIEALKETK